MRHECILMYQESIMHGIFRNGDIGQHSMKVKRPFRKVKEKSIKASSHEAISCTLATPFKLTDL